MSQLTTFVAPRPNVALIRAMDGVNRVVMLKGVVGLRDLPLVNRLAGFRGVTDIRCIDFPAADQQRLRRVTATGNSCFVTPNHPEFFTDWMIDKEIASRHFPKAAFWATNSIVNGLGRMAQKFWLANNLIAQIPGDSAMAREHSIKWALDGNVVLLHPEGSVGWHRNFVAPLMPGAAEMAEEVARRRAAAGDSAAVWLAPIVWKLSFMDDVEPALARECAYVEGRLGVTPKAGSNPAARVFGLYAALLARDEAVLGLVSSIDEPFASRHARLVETLTALVAKAAGGDPTLSAQAALRAARKQLRQSGEAATRLKKHVDMLTKAMRIGPFAWERPMMTQEEIAEHLKRLRTDHCFGSWRDTLNRFVPRPAGRRIAHIRVPEPIAMHEGKAMPEDAMAELRRRMQAALDGIEEAQAGPEYANPFWR